MAILESRRRPNRPLVSAASAPKNRGVPSKVGMAEWLIALGHTEDDINSLNVIHVAGTKGKGSTCSFIDSMLRAHAIRTSLPKKIGLYTSPHLIYPEERIRIDFHPISRELLAKYFFEVYDCLPQLAVELDTTKPPTERGPRYLQLWALLAFHAFIREGVDATILETHCGGEHDATNVVSRPIVTAVTSLGMDHIDMLGPTLEDIAWHKAGIYKRDAIALSTTQTPSALDVLRQRAKEVEAGLVVVVEDPRLPAKASQLVPSVQRENASLAAAAAQALLKRTAPDGQHGFTTEDIQNGVENWSWPGRYQTLSRGRHTWFLDAAHNEMSITLAAEWFEQTSREFANESDDIVRTIVFSHINELRDADALLERLTVSLKACNVNVQHVVFTTYADTPEFTSKQAQVSQYFAKIWQRSLPATLIAHELTIKGAIDRVKSFAVGDSVSHTLITGSQSLVGPALRLLRQDDSRPEASEGSSPVGTD
ncbi:hypothetical protein DOTSEDRAFT_62741 [Dothistroma septosporum NZE10]|uniref:tetrahydrofolate synthase n=1 Tax=Dothistroma septosporum (strain NZE10 / CBS 128990) TaxID=675120 RepID=N1PP56_DOTSN|nr:hypothetical protein DOTSEDRAFT_62741 [Dothistroma septosporum NZE10]